MLTTVALLAMCKDVAEKERGRRTDYAAAKLLGWSPQRFGALMMGERLMTDAEAIRAAELVGEDVGYVLACIRAEIAENKGTEATPYWEEVARRLSSEKSAA